MKGHEVKRASNGEPLVVLKDEFGLSQCVWNKKKFSGVPGGLFSGPAVWIWFQVPYLMQVHFLLLPWNLCHIIVYRHLEGTTQTGLQETLKEGRLNDRSKGCRNYCIWTWPLDTFAEWVFEHLLHPLLDDWKIAVGMVFLWFLSMIKCPLNSKVKLCQLDSNALR